jgi:hypothetical protein
MIHMMHRSLVGTAKTVSKAIITVLSDARFDSFHLQFANCRNNNQQYLSSVITELTSHTALFSYYCTFIASLVHLAPKLAPGSCSFLFENEFKILLSPKLFALFGFY